MTVELQIKGEVHALRLQPGDLVWVRLDERADEQTVARVRQAANEIFEGHRCVVTTGAVEIVPVREESQ